MYLQLSEPQEQIGAAAQDAARRLVAPFAAEIDRTGEYPLELVRHLAADGWLGMTLPTDVGGRGLDHLSAALAIEAFARASATVYAGIAR